MIKTYLEYLWFGVALVIVGITSLMGDSLLEFGAALTNVMCVLLVAKGRISNYYWGIAGVLLYGYASYVAGFYGNMALNLVYYAPMQIIGYLMWSKSKSSVVKDVSVQRLKKNQGVWVSSVTAVTVIALAVFFMLFSDNPSPIADSFTTVGSIVAMFLLVKRYAEQWLIWIAINIVTIYMWFTNYLDTGEGLALIGMWIVFLINSLFGAYKWYFQKIDK